jgi:hypothetical protein
MADHVAILLSTVDIRAGVARLDEALRERLDQPRAPEQHEFTLETERRAFEAFALLDESRIGGGKVAMRPRWF